VINGYECTKFKQMRKIFFGDIHGCFDELLLLLEKLSYNEKQDILYFVGDMINKGPKSKEVLDFIISHNCISILGNHEYYFLKSLKEGNTEKFNDLILNLGTNLTSKYLPYLKSLKLFYNHDQFLMVHAGIIPNVALKEISPNILTTIRTWDGVGNDLNNPKNPGWDEFYKDKKLIIHGHWAARGFYQKENIIGLDSGCVWGNFLTAYVLETNETFQVKALDKYLEY